MPKKWNYLIVVTPLHGQTVWIRQLLIEMPVQATWDAGTDTFTVPGLTPIPWYFISMWRAL